ncbi:protein kinase domain-containing protein [Paludisphaera rhizosphaerae]|uniref:protein kinase domain-containing protein n=1 Tax=Paludisphaera rhizosphaerae TaxID=2711216 RepID=UPI0013EAF883|nr:protein kinase [Paludisphaera rhizosphaerae]
MSAYLKEFPELREASNRVVSLVYEEYCLREERGEPLDVDSFCDRYAPWKDSLKAQLGYHRILSQAAGLTPPRPSFPKEGEWFEEFELLKQIGKGGYSRVFLAADHSLGGKRVVLKVALDRGREAEAQGALDHPHIVPVNSVAFPDQGEFRGLSMPYRPGLPLDDVVHRLRVDGRRPRSASELWDAMAAGVRNSAAPISEDLANALKVGPNSDGWRGFPINGSFAQGVAWIGMVLARALAYAHDHRTFHRDVKPGNVLLTVQHGPQLLDFNLAQSPHSADEANSAFQGGTLPYMAPEQIEAFLNPARWADVSDPADVYSLGLVLRELLTGEPLDAPNGKLLTPRALQNLLDRRLCLASDIRRHAPNTPHGLEAIVQKCLLYDPEERYSARQLAEDLERFLQRLPLIHTENPSRTERLGNWAVRNRRLLAANAFYLAVLALISPLLIQKATLLLLPDLKNQPDMHRAVRAVDSGSYTEAVPILENLVKLYPDSSLLHFYLSFARNGVGSSMPSPAQFDYAKAIKLPGAHEELRAWSAGRSEVVEHLIAFANSRLGHYNDETQKNRDMTPEELAPLRAELETAADAFEMALELSSVQNLPLVSADALQGLATIAEIHSDLEKAYERLTAALETTIDPKEATQKALLGSLRTQRCRVSIRRAKKAIEADDEARAKALPQMDEALADLDLADTLNKAVNQSLRRGCRTEALLTRSLLHHRLGNDERGRTDCLNAKEALDDWIDMARAEGNPIDQTFEDEYRRRHRELLQRFPTSTDSG